MQGSMACTVCYVDFSFVTEFFSDFFLGTTRTRKEISHKKGLRIAHCIFGRIQPVNGRDEPKYLVFLLCSLG